MTDKNCALRLPKYLYIPLIFAVTLLLPCFCGDILSYAQNSPVMAEESGDNDGLTVERVDGPLASLQDDYKLEISGFADSFYLHDFGVGQDNSFEIGQVEIDLEKKMTGNIDVACAITYDAENELFALGDLFIDIHLFGSEGNHFPQALRIDHSGIIVGQFDVPFGIDWQVYPSIDRKLVSGPLVVEKTHNFWSDCGIQGHLSNKRFTAVLYATNGFDYELENDNGAVTGITTNSAAGGHIGLFPGGFFEIGVSYAHLFNDRENNSMSLSCLDFQTRYKDFSAKGEFIHHSIVNPGDKFTTGGYYVQGMYEFGKFFTVARHGMFLTDFTGDNDMKRLCIGCGRIIIPGAEFRIEYQTQSGKKSDTLLTQMSFGF